MLWNLVAVAASAQEPRSTEWTAYAGSTWSNKYAPLDQINKGNVRDLKIAWRWSSPENDLKAENKKYRPGWYEPTPLMIGGVLYTSTSHSHAAAIDPKTGETIWVYDSKSHEAGRPTNTGFVHRGLTYWTDGTQQRLLMGTGDAHLIALDLATGTPIETFGNGGRIDLPRLGWPHRGAPLVTKSLLFVSQEGPWGNMRFSARICTLLNSTFGRSSRGYVPSTRRPASW